MSLLPATLARRISAVFADQIASDNQSPADPGFMLPDVSEALAVAYHSWIIESVPRAAALTMLGPGDPSVLGSQLLGSQLFRGWGPGLLLYWTPVVWGNAPGFAPANPTIAGPVAGVQGEMEAFIAPPPKVQDQERAAERIADMLHRYTAKIQVTVTPTPGSPFVTTIV